MVSLQDLDTRNPVEREKVVRALKDRARRALAAYWRSPELEHHAPVYVLHVLHDSFDYVELSNAAWGVLALYRVRGDGQLKRLRRLPKFDGDVRREHDDELERVGPRRAPCMRRRLGDHPACNGVERKLLAVPANRRPARLDPGRAFRKEGG